MPTCRCANHKPEAVQGRIVAALAERDGPGDRTARVHRLRRRTDA
ncbi:hypothetical protein ACWGIN_29650 [Streptomyces sp. NPDC054861]